jgi:hypothetical protein
MKHHRSHHQLFFKELARTIQELRHLRKNETHVLSIHANFGHYELVIRPAEASEQHPRSAVHPIEINGEIHHLFLSSGKVRPQPSRAEIRGNLKHTVILRGLSLHLMDPRGDGRHLSHNGNNGMHAREYINLAGPEGELLIEKVEHSPEMSMAAYRIAQKDIIHALRKHRRESLEIVQ